MFSCNTPSVYINRIFYTHKQEILGVRKENILYMERCSAIIFSKEKCIGEYIL